jgi:hypothetical protein
MAVKIDKKIKGYSVVTPEDKAKEAARPAPVAAIESLPTADVIQMHERIERPEILIGSTYKIKSPLFEHALYVTINDIVLNAGTEHELRRPFEIFINSKNMDHFQWIVALTRIMSAVFRKGGDVTFLVDEMKAVFDPKAGGRAGQHRRGPPQVDRPDARPGDERRPARPDRREARCVQPAVKKKL